MSASRMSPARRAETVEYRILMAVGFGIFLAVELVSRLVPHDGAPRRSIVEEARAAAGRTVPLAFMG